MNIKNKFLQIIKQVVSTLVDSDNSLYPVNQVSYNKKTSKVNRLSVYGLSYNPALDTWGLSFSSQGKESTKYVLFNDLDKKIRGLAAGEVALYNPESKCYIKMKNDGGIEFNAAGSAINFVSDSLTHNGVNVGDSHKHDAGTIIDGEARACTGKTDVPE